MELRTNETISVTDIQRRAKEIFERIERGDQDKYVVLKNNEITAVLLPADRYEALMDELEDLRIDAIAAERVLTFDPAKAITHEDMLARFGIDDLIEQ
ncbi:MAG: type II toxin-antitoxin system prevent-host-death family antitoxin [Rhodocyclaceae bacterium]|jgi:antitoxin StbD|nr:type II toxin-antitoxin system prevent-host-death family antitoxin [Rhodocyclaceae bacterium]